MAQTLEEYVTKDALRATFALNDPAYVLEISVSRSVTTDPVLKKKYIDTSCGLYCHVHHADKKKDDAPSFRFSVFASTIRDSDTELSRITFTSHHKGIRLNTECGEVENIASKERDKLLEFLKNLRGFRIDYTADLFGFLKKDGSDKPVFIELPFPKFARETVEN